jgi:hypothetical protein
VGVVDDDIQMTITLIRLNLQLLHHFIEGTDIDTTYINSGTSGICERFVRDSHIVFRCRQRQVRQSEY